PRFYRIDTRRMALISEVIAIVVVQPMSVGRIDLRRTVVMHAMRASAWHVVLPGPGRVVANVEVEPAVAIVIAKRGAGGKSSAVRRVQSHSICDVCKLTCSLHVV